MSFKLPSLVALRAFEAVARCGSVRGAAEDLFVVHGAVSQQIRGLEAQLGVSLFERRGRKLVLTHNGQRFADAVQDAFGAIERAVNELTPTDARRPFRLGIMATFGAYWLVPRISTFADQRPGFDIELVTVPVLKNLEDTNLDAVVVGGDYEPRPELVGTKFMEDAFGPVIAPDYMARVGVTGNPATMAKAVAIVATPQAKLWDSWFFDSHTPSIRFLKRREFDSLTLAIEASRAGLGIAVVPRPYIVNDLRTGRLVAPYSFAMRSGGYHFCCRSRDANLPAFKKVRNWLVAQGESYLLDSQNDH